MSLGEQTGILIFIGIFCLIFILPTIVAIISRNRFWWAILIANLCVPVTPLIWVALLITAMKGHKP